MTETPKFQTEFLNEYLEMVEDTESPRLFHVWAAVGGLSATLGRRVQLPFGPYTMFPNQYILLVGNPATRKSAAISNVRKILAEATSVRFAPKDTAGQRQGLAKAMLNLSEEQENLEEMKELFEAPVNSMASLMGENYQPPTEAAEEIAKCIIHEEDKHVLSVCGGEFSTFVGQNQLAMLDFLTTMWDGEDYDYMTKSGSVKLDKPLLNILGCTTPVSIANSMPPAAGGQGFLSRVILVHGAEPYKQIPRPPPFNAVLSTKLHQRFVDAQLLNGLASETPDARKYCDELYAYELEIEDPRFGYYKGRRQSHLIKTALALMAARGTTQLIKEDYMEAHTLLKATERGMPDALGEFGLSPLAALKQGILELCRALKTPLPLTSLVSKFHREARSKDIIEAVNDLCEAGLLKSIRGMKNEIIVTAIMKRDTKVDESLLNLLSQD